jgi:adenylylsulfate kinase
LRAEGGKVVWFTGLSGAGKSTICLALAEELKQRMRMTQILDGDMVRRQLCSDLGFGMEDRCENIRRLSYVANLLAENGVVVLVAVITPLRTMQERVRAVIPDVLQVYVDAPLEVCEARDVRGLYRDARIGRITNLTGLGSPYEPPLTPDVICHTAVETVEESCRKVLSALLPLESQDGVYTNDSRGLTIAVDFDGVIANYDGWQGEDVLGIPRIDVVDAMKSLRLEGWKIIIHTTRSGDVIEDYMNQHQIPYDEINYNSDYVTESGKPIATVYWHDRALRYSGDARRDIQLIRCVRTWNGRR